MAIIKMREVTLFALESDKDRIIEDIQKIGEFETIETSLYANDDEILSLAAVSGDESVLSEMEQKLSQVDWALKYLKSYDKSKKGLFKMKTGLSVSDFYKIEENKDALFEKINSLRQADNEITRLKADDVRTNGNILSLSPWENLDIPVDTQGTAYSKVVTGTIPAVYQIEEIKKYVEDYIKESFISFINSDKDFYYVTVFYHVAREDEFLEFARVHSFSKVNFKDSGKTVQEIINQDKASLVDIEKRKNNVIDEIKKMVELIPHLERFYDFIATERDKYKAFLNTVMTKSAFMVKGWCPHDMVSRIEDIQKSFNCLVVVREPEKGEEYPIKLKNNTFVEPFEFITDMYSPPKSTEVDPNAFMAPFYFIAFGVMMGDMAYGLIMMIASFIILKKYKPDGGFRKFMKMFGICGISTFIFGMLFGSFFSDVLSILFDINLPSAINPMKDPIVFVGIAFVFGAIQIFVGVGIKAYMLIRDGDVFAAIFDCCTWIILIPSLVMLALPAPFSTIGKVLAIASAAALVLTQGRDKKNILLKIGSGIISLYGITSYASDILSYSRLLALCLSSGVIGSVFNTMGAIGGKNVIGIIMFILIFTVGQVFNLALGALGAYVHSCRLQYVEFYGKFYEGGGKVFNPLKINSKYIKITVEEDV